MDSDATADQLRVNPLYYVQYFIQTHQFLQTLSKNLHMKQTQKNSPLFVETSSQRKQRIKRNRQIAKQKYYAKHQSQSAETKETCQEKCTTREERAHIQKLKNRQAAQKSRQQKKQHIKILQEQIQVLKLKISSLKYCQNCRKQIHHQFSQMDQHPQSLQQSPFDSTNVASSSIGMDSQEEVQFMRSINYDDNSSIGIYLFIGMIVLGVFCFGLPGNVDGTGPMRRDLTQLYAANQFNSLSNIDTVEDFGQTPVYQQNYRTSYSTVDDPSYLSSDQNFENGLLTLDQIRSPRPIQDQTKFKAIISSFQAKKLNQTHLRSVVKKMNDQKSLIFCGKPKLYTPRNQGNNLITSFIDIFVEGTQIEHLLQGDPHNSNGVHLSGLYKVSAQISSITQVQNINFAY